MVSPGLKRDHDELHILVVVQILVLRVAVDVEILVVLVVGSLAAVKLLLLRKEEGLVTCMHGANVLVMNVVNNCTTLHLRMSGLEERSRRATNPGGAPTNPGGACTNPGDCCESAAGIGSRACGIL